MKSLKKIILSFAVGSILLLSSFGLNYGMEGSQDCAAGASQATWPSGSQPQESQDLHEDSSLETISYQEWKDLPLSTDYLLEITNKFIKKMTTEFLSEDSQWTASSVELKRERIENISNRNSIGHYDNPLLSYTSKFLINSQESKIVICGDMHGLFDQTLDQIICKMIENELMDENLILAENVYFIGLGDYVDRGGQSLKTLATLLLMVIKNGPEKIKLIRGNHENLRLNEAHGLPREIESLIQQSNSLPDKNKLIILNLYKTYELLPLAIYLCARETIGSESTKILLLTHASLEIRYNPRNFLTSGDQIKFDLIRYTRYAEFQDISKKLPYLSPAAKLLLQQHFSYIKGDNCDCSGFSWNDFNFASYFTHRFAHCLNEPVKSYRSIDARILALPSSFVETFLNVVLENTNFRIEGLIRGHDHNIAKEWYANINNISRNQARSIKTPSISLRSGTDSYFLVDEPIAPSDCGNFSVTTVMSGKISRDKSKSHPDIVYSPTFLLLNLDYEDNVWMFASINCSEQTEQQSAEEDVL